MRRTLHTVCLIIFIAIQGFAQDAAYNWVSPITGSGSAIIQSTSLGVDLGGATLTTGYFLGSADFDPGAGSATLNAASSFQGYIQKLNAFGGFVWAKQIGGTGQTRGQGLDVGTGNNVYSIGFFQGTVDLDPNAGTVNKVSNGGNDIYVSKLSSSGNYTWGIGIGGTGADFGRAIAVDEDNNVYVTGSFQNTVDFDPGAGTVNLVSAGNADIFIAKFSSSGSFVWAKRIGSTGNDFGLSIDARNGQVLVAGTYQNTVDFDPGAGTANLTSAGGSDAFVLKLDTSGTFTWVKAVGGTSDDFGNSVVINDLGDVFLGGDFQGTADLNPSATTLNIASLGDRDVFILKLNSSGTFQWVKTAGGSGEDRAINIAVDTSEYVYIGGHFSNTVDFDPSAGMLSLNSLGATDSYIWKLTSAGDLVYAKQMGSAGSEGGYDIAIDESGFVYSTGIYQNTVDFDPGFGVVNKTANLIDGYVHKMGPCNLGLDTLTVFACDSAQSPTGAHTWYTSGTYYDTLLAASGCDSIITVYLTVGYVNSSSINVTTCDSYNSPSGNYTWTSTGVYMDTVTNVSGCDSIMTINLTILNSTSSSMSPVVCDSFTSPSGLYTYYSSGTYSDTLVNAVGCDSVITINLTVSPTTYQSFNLVICDSMESPSGNYTWTANGTYVDTIINSNGCDSIMTFTLSVKHSSFGTINPVACESYDSPSSNYTWTTSGTYMDTIANGEGCDSIMTINLTIIHNSFGSVSPTVCDSYTSPSGNYTWTSSNTYLDTIPNAIGCDSIITVNLTVNPTHSTPQP
ncbi:MAG: SBBP repeat-containing protein [Flavobacteriales bacterium]